MYVSTHICVCVYVRSSASMVVYILSYMFSKSNGHPCLILRYTTMTIPISGCGANYQNTHTFAKSSMSEE